jgi:peptidoglycan hydrolase-like protein with peptidoglycan-binding domain
MTHSLRAVQAGFVLVGAMVFMFPFIARADTLNRELSVGMSGTDVSALQTFLASDVSLYPQALITGYFGELTKVAVTHFQTRNGISAVGRVGPITLGVLNVQMEHGMGKSSMAAPDITNVRVGTNSSAATVSWNTDELAQGIVYYSTTPLSFNEHEHSVEVSGATAMTDATMRNAQNVTISGLLANTIYYYLIYTIDQAGNVSVTWPSTFRTMN